LTILPQVVTGGCTPIPRKISPASANIVNPCIIIMAALDSMLQVGINVR
jgi:hypothetical protein